jgi:23S rRNA (adenine2030-N6)-methyltransferase
VLHLDGWTALHALIPPKERRGLVLIDPPYEQPGELERLATEMAKALRKWPTGIFLG